MTSSNMPHFNHTESGKEFEWSESGRELLKTICEDIIKHGGPDKLANAIEGEWLKSSDLKKTHFWSKDHEQYLKNHYLNNSYYKLSQQLGKSESAIHHKLNRMYRDGFKRKVPNRARWSKS